MCAQLTQRAKGSVLGLLGVKLHMTSASNFCCNELPGGVISIGIVAASWLAWLRVACCSIWASSTAFSRRI